MSRSIRPLSTWMRSQAMHIELPTFRPHPLVRGGHAQTVMASFFPGERPPYQAVRHTVELDDGDKIVLHEDRGHWQAGQHVVILIHGLGGSHLSGYMVRTSAKLIARGVRVFRMDLRGWGAGFGLNRLPGHAGRSDDAKAALRYVSELCPGSPVSMIGYSMGANIVLKMAGEMGDAAPANLSSVMGVGPPIDLLYCSHNMQRGLNRFYDRTFIRWLLRHLRQREAIFAGQNTLASIPRRLVEFDELFTAPQSGFRDARDYYEQVSSGRLLKHISVPALVVAAADDPIIPVEIFERADYSSTTQVQITPSGGHLGFIGAGGIDSDRRWLDWRAVDWILGHGKRKSAWQRPPSAAGHRKPIAANATS